MRKVPGGGGVWMRTALSSWTVCLEQAHFTDLSAGKDRLLEQVWVVALLLSSLCMCVIRQESLLPCLPCFKVTSGPTSCSRLT